MKKKDELPMLPLVDKNSEAPEFWKQLTYDLRYKLYQSLKVGGQKWTILMPLLIVFKGFIDSGKASLVNDAKETFNAYVSFYAGLDDAPAIAEISSKFAQTRAFDSEGYINVASMNNYEKLEEFIIQEANSFAEDFVYTYRYFVEVPAEENPAEEYPAGDLPRLSSIDADQEAPVDWKKLTYNLRLRMFSLFETQEINAIKYIEELSSIFDEYVDGVKDTGKMVDGAKNTFKLYMNVFFGFVEKTEIMKISHVFHSIKVFDKQEYESLSSNPEELNHKIVDDFAEDFVYTHYYFIRGEYYREIVMNINKERAARSGKGPAPAGSPGKGPAPAGSPVEEISLESPRKGHAGPSGSPGKGPAPAGSAWEESTPLYEIQGFPTLDAFMDNCDLLDKHKYDMANTIYNTFISEIRQGTKKQDLLGRIGDAIMTLGQRYTESIKNETLLLSSIHDSYEEDMYKSILEPRRKNMYLMSTARLFAGNLIDVIQMICSTTDSVLHIPQDPRDWYFSSSNVGDCFAIDILGDIPVFLYRALYKLLYIAYRSIVEGDLTDIAERIENKFAFFIQSRKEKILYEEFLRTVTIERYVFDDENKLGNDPMKNIPIAVNDAKNFIQEVAKDIFSKMEDFILGQPNLRYTGNMTGIQVFMMEDKSSMKLKLSFKK